jgi:cytochrome b561
MSSVEWTFLQDTLIHTKEYIMTLKNTPTQYGWLSRVLHWSIACLVLTQFYLIYAKRYLLVYGSDQARFYMNGLHKPLGLMLLVLVLFSLLWGSMNRRPLYPAAMPWIQKILALIMHKALLIAALGMSMSGLLMSVAAGNPPNFFGVYQVPAFMEKNDVFSKFCFGAHETLSGILWCLVVVHVLAALKHHFVDKDDILRRML